MKYFLILLINSIAFALTITKSDTVVPHFSHRLAQTNINNLSSTSHMDITLSIYSLLLRLFQNQSIFSQLLLLIQFLIICPLWPYLATLPQMILGWVIWTWVQQSQVIFKILIFWFLQMPLSYILLFLTSTFH